jgi:hypothetical protein
MSAKKNRLTEIETPKIPKTPKKPKVKKVIPISRRPHRSKNPNPQRMYFNSDTQAAIVEYQGEQCKATRDNIYVSRILPAFEKLAENLINIHKFTSLHDSYDDLRTDCITFLFETIHKFDGTRGTNAFSYFNVVAKNWLIIRTKEKARRIKRTVSLDDPDALNAYEGKIVEDHCTTPSPEILLENEMTSHNIVQMLYDVRDKVKTENELACINAIITIFENINDVDLLNKGSVLLYMRELSGLTPKQLTTTMQAIRKYYKKSKYASLTSLKDLIPATT